MILPEPPLLLITDRTLTRQPLCQVIAAALSAGCRWIMVREKDLDDQALADLVREICELARPYHAAVLVNSNVAVAAACGLQGVHLPQGHDVVSARRHIGSDRWIGVSSHTLEEAESAASMGADYIIFSPIFPSISKPGYGPTLGLEQLREITKRVSIPVVALGGITPENIGQCRDAGAAGAAILGSVMNSVRPDHIVQRLLQGWCL